MAFIKGKLSLYLLMAEVKSGSSLRTVSPKVKVASSPGMPSSVLIGIRVRMDSSTSNSAGSWMTGSCRGRKPLVVDTINAGIVVSSGLVSRRTLKEGAVAMDPILNEGGDQSRNGIRYWTLCAGFWKEKLPESVWGKLGVVAKNEEKEFWNSVGFFELLSCGI